MWKAFCLSVVGACLIGVGARQALAEEFVIDDIKVRGPAFAKLKLTDQTLEWVKQDKENRLLAVWKDNDKHYVFEGDYYQEGAHYTGPEAQQIKTNQVFEKAKEWVRKHNEDPNNFDKMIKFGGIGYIGEAAGSWDDPHKHDNNVNHHKFGGVGRAYILEPARK